MSPITHFIASWAVGAMATDDPRDSRLVTLAGMAPDLDGLGLAIDIIKNIGAPTISFYYYQQYHHYLLHGAAGAGAVALLCGAMARSKFRVFALALFAFHLHLFCDFLGSRGPDPADLWPIYYFGPFSTYPMWRWGGQWKLHGWQNQLISVLLLAWSYRFAVLRGHSFVGVVNKRADAIFVATLRKWRDQIAGRCSQQM